MNGKGSTVTFTSTRLQVRALWSNHAPDHYGVLSSYWILFLMIFFVLVCTLLSILNLCVNAVRCKPGWLLAG